MATGFGAIGVDLDARFAEVDKTDVPEDEDGECKARSAAKHELVQDHRMHWKAGRVAQWDCRIGDCRRSDDLLDLINAF